MVDARRDVAWSGPRRAVGYATVRVHFAGGGRAALLFADVMEAGGSAEAGTRCDGRCPGDAAGGRDHADSEQAGHRLLDHAPLHAQPLPIWRADHVRHSPESPAALRTPAPAATRIQNAGFVSRPYSREHSTFS